MKVVFSKPASADLLEIGDWIAQSNRDRALTFVEELEEACAGLAENPLRFQIILRHQDEAIRRRVHGAYLIFYRVEAAQVTVVRILHGSRDYEALLFPDPGSH